jgi:hypothetical protein
MKCVNKDCTDYTPLAEAYCRRFLAPDAVLCKIYKSEMPNFSTGNVAGGQDHFDKKFDEGKVLFGLVDPEFEKEVAEILTFGKKKYSEDSWQTVPDGEKRYRHALLRHLNASRNGEVIDEESGLSHLAHAACNLMFLSYLYRS